MASRSGARRSAMKQQWETGDEENLSRIEHPLASECLDLSEFANGRHAFWLIFRFPGKRILASTQSPSPAAEIPPGPLAPIKQGPPCGRSRSRKVSS
jgi:hypothetical protein